MSAYMRLPEKADSSLRKYVVAFIVMEFSFFVVALTVYWSAGTLVSTTTLNYWKEGSSPDSVVYVM